MPPERTSISNGQGPSGHTFAAFMQGAELLNKLNGGDVIVRAEVLSGADKLVRPAPPAGSG
jgi:hypothetical protein